MNLTVFAFVSLSFILLAFANFRLYCKLKTVNAILPIRSGRSLPELGVGVEWPAMKLADQKGRMIQLGGENVNWFLLLTSLSCEVCRELDFFLAANGGVLKGRTNFYIATFDDGNLLAKKLWPGSYSIIAAQRLGNLVKTGTVPVVFKVVNNRVSGAFLINTGEQLMSIVAPELV